MFQEYDVIVVGAGHAGCEAAAAAATMGSVGAADHNEYAHHRTDVVQPRNGGRRQRTDRPGDRRTRRTIRDRLRQNDDPIPDAQPLQRSCHVESHAAKATA